MYASGFESQIKILDEVKVRKFKEFENKIKTSNEKLKKLDLKEKYMRQKQYND
jgi:hypothetical protein